MAVRGLLHYALEVPDPTKGAAFYGAFGLTSAQGRRDAVALRPAAQTREAVLLYDGPRKRLHHLAFAAAGGDFVATRQSLQRAGVREIDPPRGAPEGGVWVRDPDGRALNVRDEMPTSSPPDPLPALNGPGYAPRQAVRGCPDAAQPRPRRLGHVLLFTPDLERQIDFYTHALGMRLSDRSGEIIAFLRCSTDHHNVALAASPGPGFHHGSFEVGSVDEIAMAAQWMLDATGAPGWGLGRHVIGSNYFYYARDPWGSFAEYFYDLDYIPEECAWQPRDFPADDALYRWGPTVPADFVENKELST